MLYVAKCILQFQVDLQTPLNLFRDLHDNTYTSQGELDHFDDKETLHGWALG
jgi:hypothetical protein